MLASLSTTRGRRGSILGLCNILVPNALHAPAADLLTCSTVHIGVDVSASDTGDAHASRDGHHRSVLAVFGRERSLEPRSDRKADGWGQAPGVRSGPVRARGAVPAERGELGQRRDAVLLEEGNSGRAVRHQRGDQDAHARGHCGVARIAGSARASRRDDRRVRVGQTEVVVALGPAVVARARMCAADVVSVARARRKRVLHKQLNTVALSPTEAFVVLDLHGRADGVLSRRRLRRVAAQRGLLLQQNDRGQPSGTRGGGGRRGGRGVNAGGGCKRKSGVDELDGGREAGETTADDDWRRGEVEDMKDMTI